jgi:hypothetical protein
VKLEGGEARYAFFDEGAADRHWSLDAMPRSRREVKALQFGGHLAYPHAGGGCLPRAHASRGRQSGDQLRRQHPANWFVGTKRIIAKRLMPSSGLRTSSRSAMRPRLDRAWG